MHQTATSRFAIGGTLSGQLILPAAELDHAQLRGLGHVRIEPTVTSKARLLFRGRHNAFVNQGLRSVLDSAYADLTADRISHIGVSGDASPVTAQTVTLGTPNSIKLTSGTSRLNQTVTTQQTWTQADVSFPIKRFGLLVSSSPTDVVNIIGGDGGAAPYDEALTFDLTAVSTWSLTLAMEVTAIAS